MSSIWLFSYQNSSGLVGEQVRCLAASRVEVIMVLLEHTAHTSEQTSAEMQGQVSTSINGDAQAFDDVEYVHKKARCRCVDRLTPAKHQ